MRLVFPYQAVEGIATPMIRFSIRGEPYSAMLDSGSYLSIFRPMLADELGIRIETGAPLTVTGVGGPISGYLHNLTIEVGGQSVDLRVFFSRKYTLPFHLIGRDPFFRRFFVTFDEVGRRVILNPRGKAR